MLAVVSVVALGALAAACQVTPQAASVNGDTISVSSLNAQMGSLAGAGAGQCLLALRSGQAISVDTGGAAYPTAYASAVLSSEVGNLVAAQFAAAHGVHLTSSDIATARTNYTAALDGRITALVQQATASGGLSVCQKADGSAITGQQLLAALPASVRNSEIANQAVDNALLARGADLSDAAVLAFYSANQPLFTIDCVSDIATASQADADAVVAKLKAGQNFAKLATSSSVDAQTAANGGQLGCNFTESRVLSALQLTTVTVGQPVTPIQTSGGTWVVYEVTSQQVVPVTEAASVIRDDLLHTTANTQRVTTELLLYAHHSSVTVNPQYGTWQGIHIVPPPNPPARYLQPSYVLPAATTAAGGTAATGTGASTTSGG
jgi:parvulin-like peptidyl-prolyl isomerase